MADDATMRTIAAGGSGAIKEKGSKFIALAFPVATIGEAEECVQRIRRAEHAATHHCFAYRIGPRGGEVRAVDDGEPSGTAGQPILRQIEARSLTNVLVVVTRYFGGTKLGTGGLMRAYGDAAASALSGCRSLDVVVRARVTIRFRYEDTSPVMRLVDRFDAEVVQSQYATDTRLELLVPVESVRAFESEFTESLSGRGAVEHVGEEGT